MPQATGSLIRPAVTPSVRAVNHVEAGPTCVVELEATVDAHVARFADVFSVGTDGRVQRLAISTR